MINKRVKALMRIIFPVIFILYAGSITFFTHTHIVDGVTIVHSHPFQKNSEGHPTHEHTGIELQLIQSLSTFFATGLVLLFISLGMVEAAFVILQTRQFTYYGNKNLCGLSTLRSPPVLL